MSCIRRRTPSGLRGWLEHAASLRDGERLAFTLPFLQHLDGHRLLYRQCIRQGEITVGREIRAMLREMIRESLMRDTGAHHDSTSLALTSEYLMGALSSVVTYWMTTAPELSADDVDRRFRRLVFSGLPGTTA